jgi:hypothetical protein
MKPLYKVYKIKENETEQLKSSLVNKGYSFENTKFYMCGNDKNSSEPALSIYFENNMAAVIRDSQGLLFVFINKEVGRNLDKILEIE